MKKTLLTAAIALTASLFSLSAQAAEPFPTKSIQVVIPFAPGDTDNMLRPFLDKMGEFLGQPVLLTYKAGAGGGVGAGIDRSRAFV
jgi:tripartite-type tricarboxylate transporter receptor subunit TctC